jgi:predicted metal-binding membrane protein
MRPQAKGFKSERCRGSFSPMDVILRHSASRPRLAMALCLAAILSVSGIFLWMSAGPSFAGWLRLLCTPTADAGLAQVTGLWLAMTLAMMIPSAAPMISTYLDIAEAAAAKQMKIASPLWLAAGYGAIWISFALIASFGQWAALTSGYAGDMQGRFAGLILIGAGAYQFTALKQACLSKCRAPMSYFLAHWSDRPLGVLRMGLDQGLNCFGCCWALMMLSFVAGLMNILWMGILGIVMVLEKTLGEPKPLIYGLGAGLIGAGLFMVFI